MVGWTGKFLHVNLSKSKAVAHADERGIPRKSALKSLGLEHAANELGGRARLLE